jgi:hypothetical protein
MHCVLKPARSSLGEIPTAMSLIQPRHFHCMSPAVHFQNQFLLHSRYLTKIEGGPTFVTPLIEKQQIDALYVTRVLLQGDGDFFDETILKHGYRLVDESVHEENSNPVAFQIWKPKL